MDPDTIGWQVNLDLNDLNKKIESSFNKLQEVVTNEDKCREIVFTS